MIELLKQQPGILVYLLLQYMALAFGGSSALFLMPGLALGFYMATKKMLYPFLALMLLLPLADSNLGFAQVALNTRPILLLLITLLVYSHGSIYPKVDGSMKAFLPYFLVLGYFLMDVQGSGNLFRPLSYVLVIVVTPVVVKYLLGCEKDEFLRSLVLLYTLVYVFSFVNISTNAALVEYGRFSGIFSNPNALGIFSFLFFMMTQIIFKYQPQLFTKWERYVVTGLIIGGVLYSRSRSGMFAIAIFWGAIYVYQRWQISGLVLSVVGLVIFSWVISFEDLIRGLGLAEFFRMDTLETGSGRKIAMMEAWGQIKANPLDGYGIGYTERFFTENQAEMQRKGHAGSVHNSFLWVWLDMGFLGLLTFIWGWFRWFVNTYQYSILVLPVGLAVAFSSNVESWLVGSLNHVTIQLVIILSLLSNSSFLSQTDQQSS